MKIKSLTNTIVFILFLSFSLAAHAGEKNSRKGFTFGLSSGFAGINASGFNQFGSMGNLRLGYGLNEQILFFVEQHGGFTAERLIFNLMFNVVAGSAQIFMVPDLGFYLRPSVGLGVVLNSSASTAGFSMGSATGYEFRVGKSFAIGPEGRFDYYRAGGQNRFLYGVGVGVQFYF